MKLESSLKYIQLVKDLVKRLKLDLTGHCVLTECASNGYAYTPIIAAIAGANVYAVGKDSKFGQFEDNKNFILNLSEQSHAKGKIEFFKDNLPEEKWIDPTVITNSGFLRPFTKAKIEKLNNKAVICLMWETWEFRPEEIDLKSCLNNNVLVIGTNEGFIDANMYGYPGMLCLKLLFEAGFPVVNNTFVLIGEGLTGCLIAKTFFKLGIRFHWFVDSVSTYKKHGPCKHYSELPSILELDHLDAIICADHVSKTPPIGKLGFIKLDQIKKKFPHITWAHLTGPVNVEELTENSITFYPREILPVGYMTFETQELGIEPVIVLNSAGLKVGELCANSRMQGENIDETIKICVDHGIGQDFEGGFSNLTTTK